MQADNNKCGVGVAYNSKVGGKIFFANILFCVLASYIYIALSLCT